MHALIRNGSIVFVGRLDPIWWDGSRWWDFREGGVDPASLGWLPVVEQPRPADTATATWERADPALVAGIPTVAWVERPKTAEEVAADQAAAEREAARLAVRAIVTDLQAEKARAQTVIDKTNAQIGPGDTKDVARAAKRIADAAIDLAKFVRY